MFHLLTASMRPCSKIG